jgi:hypothetical protein
MTYPHPMPLPRDATHIGVASVDDRETRRPVGRLAVIRHDLPLFSTIGVIGRKVYGAGFRIDGARRLLNVHRLAAVRVSSGR